MANNNNSSTVSSISIKDGKYCAAALATNDWVAQRLLPKEKIEPSVWEKMTTNKGNLLIKKANEVCKQRNLFKYIPWFIVQMRFTPQEAAYMLVKWIDHCNLASGQFVNVRKALVWRTNCIDNLENALKRDINEEPALYPSYMNKLFHPPPSFPKLNLALINKIFTAAGENAVTLEDAQSMEGLFDILSRLEVLCGVSGIDPQSLKYRKRSRKQNKNPSVNYYGVSLQKNPTYTAIYPGLTHKERKAKLHKSLWHFRMYNKALEQAGRIRGRLRNFFNPFITQTCAKLDKTGLATIIINDAHKFVESDPLTVIFVALAASEFSQRKAFTLESQQQGGLEQCLQYLYGLLQESKTSQWDLVASLYPMQKVLSHLDQQQLSYLLERWIKFQIPVAKYLENQWNFGVAACAQKNMMVPRRGTTSVSSSGWNVVSGTWNNIVRFIRALSVQMQQQPPVIMKCLKLTAADQMQWAEWAGQDEQVDIRVFVNLVNKGITPWGIMLGKCQCTEGDILQACQEEKVDPKRWLGSPQERSKESTLASDMICGVSVPSSLVMQEILKTLGAYGYKPYQVKNNN